MSVLDHPSIAGRIQLLEQEVQAKQDNLDSLRNDYRLLQERGAQYAERVKNVIFELYREGGYDEDTLLAVMRNLDIDTRSTKTFEVNVTFTMDIEYALGEDVDTSNFDWDLEFDVKSGDYEVTDFSTDIIYSNEA